MTSDATNSRTANKIPADKQMFLAVIDDLKPADELDKCATPRLSTSGKQVQEDPIYFKSGANIVASLKIDTARITDRQLEIWGWCAGEIQLQLLCNGQPLKQIITHNLRPDVAETLKWAEPEKGFGFTLKAMALRTRRNQYTLQIQYKDGQKIRSFQHPLDLEKVVSLGEISSGVVHAIGHLEVAAASHLIQETIVVGWVINEAYVTVWLESENGDKHLFNNALRIFRQDVFDAYAHSFGHDAREGGFMLLIHGILPGEKIRLMAMSGDESIVLGIIECARLEATSIACARWLLGIATPLSQMQKRMPLIDGPIIDAFLRYEQQGWTELSLQIRQFGKPAVNPYVSVIVPLYGRIDFVEHQLIEFCHDAWFIENAELIYILDDPKLTDIFPALAEQLYRLYRLSFKWVWGGVNRGFSGANNLGASQATGKHLLFLNSDAFPQQPGWLQQLLSVLDDHPEIGAVGPRLVFADGSIQHASMEFMRREELGIWINHHPCMGLDPTLDPAHHLTLVPAITGACLAIRRSDFDRIGGWDTGYLIGDFEDSDLCLKLHAEGLKIAYLPTVQLTHLERQSFKLLGQDDFRTRVTIYNAVRHQNRWQHLIEGLADNHG
ncbi:glycosyltransferase family 2 protein [Nitrosomonas ureae]|uniref:Glycosyltransferase, GT2 family n=1 Tax=Nitrosomonas ureae TaxID=44577 RepID=A0A1H5UHT5_9PROT|nr:glycosyltransferase family 2 protein [Nitrosomonas ureae]SEF74590.1 Glycosyltransferase, GT2 family [Nitrosomonas ureae]